MVLLAIAWSLYNLYPPTSRDLVQVFRERAVNKDATFSNIWYHVVQLQQQRPDRAYATSSTPSAPTTFAGISLSSRAGK